MKKITKSKEPKEWTEYRLIPGVKYSPLPELREALLKEQGYLCAYCMRRIPTKDGNSDETSRIEHLKSRKKHPDLQLDYSNMVVCCPGAIGDGHNFHCDKLKGENDVSFDLFDDHFISTISYSSKDGCISSSNENFDKEMNEILNLNHPLLRMNRLYTLKGVIEGLQREMSKKVAIAEKNGWKSAAIARSLAHWKSKDAQGAYAPYCGMVEWFLNKKLQRKK